MKVSNSFNTIDTHTGGEPTRILLDTPYQSPNGASVKEFREWFSRKYDWVRELLLKEPRGHDDMFGAIPVPASSERADFGLFFMDNGGYLDMCGHATIGTVTAFVESGRLPASDQFIIETPAGEVTAEPVLKDGGVEKVWIQNVESFVSDTLQVTIEGVGSIPVDIVYAGNLFAMVDAGSLPLHVAKENTDSFVEYGMAIREAVNENHQINNPLSGDNEEVSLVEFYERGDDADRNITVFSDGLIDRSACGTGTCAKMTLMQSDGALEVGSTYLHESVLGTRFEGQIVEARERDGITVTIPKIAGAAFITSTNTFTLDPDDPVTGFSLSSE